PARRAVRPERPDPSGRFVPSRLFPGREDIRQRVLLRGQHHRRVHDGRRRGRHGHLLERVDVEPVRRPVPPDEPPTQPVGLSKSGLPKRLHVEEADMRLYEFPPTRSIRVRWTLQELGVPFEAVTVNLIGGDHHKPEFLALNPAAKIPVLVDGDVVLTESVATVMYLADKYPEHGRLPSSLAARGQAYRWLLFAATELEQPLWRIARHTNLYPEEQRLPADVAIAGREFVEMAAVLARHMEGREFIVGAHAGVVDFV